MDLQTLKLQIGFQNPLSNFRIAMRQIAAANAIPDYDVQLIEDLPDADASPVRQVASQRKPGP
ncbi:MAG: hypothetical protein ABW184_10085 [Sphingobium sp.]